MSVVTLKEHGKSYLINNPGGHIGEPIGHGRPYEKKLLDYIYNLGLATTLGPASAVDVGAHVGNHTLHFAAVCGFHRVYSFEPDRASYELLVKNVKLNPQLREQILTYRLALGAVEGRAAVDGTMTIVEGDDFDVVRADDALPPIPDLRVVKIDVEGFEPQVMMGMAGHLKRSDAVVFAEAHTDRATRAQEAAMNAVGYQFAHYLKMGSRMAVWRRG